MLQGILHALDATQMEKLHNGALRVLEQTGLQIQGRFLLAALAESGCKVDFESRRAWFKPDLVERQIAAQRDRYRLVRSSLWYPFCRCLPRDDVAVPDEYIVDYGYTTPWIYDYPEGRYRKPTIQDQVNMIRLGNALPNVKAVSSPLICGEFDPRMESIESARLLLRNTRKPGWTGTHCGKEVKYLAEMASLAVDGDRNRLTSEPPLFVAAYCTTSPLKLDVRSCDVLEQALLYGFPVNFAPMPILGATAPITPAGAAIVALAEILGCMAATTLINSDVFYFSTSISAEMDMRTTQVCFCTPAAILTDVVLHQMFRYRYGLVHNIEPGYVEAKTPGIQATFMKTYRQMAFGCTASLPLPIGGLDNGAVFSPTQAMLDLEMNEPIYRFARGIEMDDDACAVDLIQEMLFCQDRAYLETQHTVRRYRSQGWYPRLFDRAYCEHTAPAQADDTQLLRRADDAWRKLVAAEAPVELDRATSDELDRIVEAARRELLAEG